MLRPGGRLAVLEVATPPGRVLGAGFPVLVRTGRAGDRAALLSDGDAYRYLPQSDRLSA